MVLKVCASSSCVFAQLWGLIMAGWVCGAEPQIFSGTGHVPTGWWLGTCVLRVYSD